MDYKNALVVDNGSGILKYGYTGEDYPMGIFPSVVAKRKHKLRRTTRETFIGKEAQRKREILNVRYPITHGVVTDWGSMEKVWHHAFHNELRVEPSEHPLVITEVLDNPKANREKMTEVLFEKFRFPAMFVAPKSLLSLYAAGRITAITLHVGDGVTCVTPIYEGSTIPHARRRLDIAGRDLTEYLMKLLKKGGHKWVTEARWDTVCEIKETLANVASGIGVDGETSGNTSSKSYKLPDGTIIEIGGELSQCPEALFGPTVLGMPSLHIHRQVLESIMGTDKEHRPDLYSNIVLSGGSTMFPGFAERLEKELMVRTPSTKKVKVIASGDRQYGAWIGGSILASLTTFQPMYIKKQDYEESGPSIVHRMCLT